MGFIMCPECFKVFNRGFPVALFSGLMWLFLWKGNEYIYVYTDQYVSWFKTPLKRMFIGLGLMIVYSSVIVSIITFVFYILVFNQEIDDSFFAQVRQTAFFSIIVSMIIMSFFTARGFLIAWRQTAINAEKIQREHISSQYEALKNQVNPHFLFNSLNALSSLVYDNPEKAIDFINRLSEVYRYVLDSKDKEVVSLSEELTFIKSYMFLLETRFENNLIAEINIDEETGHVPPMAIQMLIENAVKHNEISDEHPLRISVFHKDQYIYVQNNIHLKDERSNTLPTSHGRGGPTVKKMSGGHLQGGASMKRGFSENTPGIGLENIKSRYSVLSDLPVKIEQSEKSFSVGLPFLQIV
jgi:LytS/YehU family sensor histidine kinase